MKRKSHKYINKQKKQKPNSILLKEVGALIRKGDVVCLTGSGISAESGIPVLRGTEGLWKKYDHDLCISAEGRVRLFRESREKYVDFVCEAYSALVDAQPNPAHLALAMLERSEMLTCIITENVDNLHQESGCRSVLELYGNAFRLKCPDCGKTIVLEKRRFLEMTDLLKINRASSFHLRRIINRYTPVCKECRKRYAVDLAVKGQLPKYALEEASKRVSACKVLMVIGVPQVAGPVAQLPVTAKKGGAAIVTINTADEPDRCVSDYTFTAAISETLSGIIEILSKGS